MNKPDLFDQIHAERMAAKNPTHIAGKITAYEEKSGLPIVRMNPREEEPEPKQEEKPAEPESKPAEEPTPQTKGGFEKDTPVQLHDGRKGRVVYNNNEMKIARIKTEDGKNVNVRHNALKALNEVSVKAHVRLVPAKESK